jgi:plastocyanin
MVLAVVALIGAACSNDENPSGGTTSAAETSGATTGTETSGGATTGTETSGGEGGQITINGDAANDHGSADVAGKDEMELELDDFYFDPTTLQGTPGQSLKLEVKNEGSTEHNFTLEDQNIDQDVEDGEDASVTVTFPDSGVLEFYCKYHRSGGMVGQLSVG